MKTDYKVLTEEEQDEIKVSYLQAQERDQFCHELNLERFNEMLKTLPNGEFRNRILQLKSDTEKRLAEVSSIVAVAEVQLPPPARIAAAKTRLTEKTANLKG